MNLLTDNTPDILFAGGFKLRIKTDFILWVKFINALNEKDKKDVAIILRDIFGEIPNAVKEDDLLSAILNWLWSFDDTTKSNSKSGSNAKAFDFIVDGNIIFCELWEYFPHLMEKGLTFQQGMELIKLLLNNEKTVLYHRAFARCGDFSKMSKEMKKYWQKERAKYAIKMSEEDFDNVFSKAFF